VPLRHVRRFIEDREKILRLPAAEGRGVRDRRDEPGHLPPAERDEDANADLRAILFAERDAIRERVIDGERDGHFDEEGGGEGKGHARMILRRAFLPERLSMRGTPAGRNSMGSGRGSCPSAPEAGSIP
jgi:hypothetical protein